MAASDSLIGEALTPSPYAETRELLDRAVAAGTQWQSLYVTRSFILAQEFAAIEPSKCGCRRCLESEVRLYRALRAKYTNN